MWDVTNGARPTAAWKGCSRAHVPHQRCGTGLCPPTYCGPCPCSQSAFGHAVGSASRLWLSCAERSLTDGWSNAHPGQQRLCTSPDMIPVSPLLPCSLPWGLTLQTSGTHIPLQWGLERPFTGETGTPTTSQSFPTHQLRTKDVGHTQRDPEP